MQREIFRGRDLRRLVRQVQRELGDDAHVLDTRVLNRSGTRVFEVTAVRAADVAASRRRLATAATPPWRRRAPGAGPCVVAVVGPGGSGKTSALVKMALNSAALGDLTVGIVTLDTVRVGAVDELQTYAEIAHLPLEVVYGPGDVAGAVERLADRDVILVDTPGRRPGAGADDWSAVLAELAPAEVHLVLPAGLRLEVAQGLARTWRPAGVTHVLPSRLDELGDRGAALQLADHLELPARWASNGQELPDDLVPADPASVGRGGSGTSLVA